MNVLFDAAEKKTFNSVYFVEPDITNNDGASASPSAHTHPWSTLAFHYLNSDMIMMILYWPPWEAAW